MFCVWEFSTSILSYFSIPGILVLWDSQPGLSTKLGFFWFILKMIYLNETCIQEFNHTFDSYPYMALMRLIPTPVPENLTTLSVP